MTDAFAKSLRGTVGRNASGGALGMLGRKKKSVRWAGEQEENSEPMDDTDESSVMTDSKPVSSVRDKGAAGMAHLRVSRTALGNSATTNISSSVFAAALPQQQPQQQQLQPQPLHESVRKRAAGGLGLGGGAMRIRTPSKGGKRQRTSTSCPTALGIVAEESLALQSSSSASLLASFRSPSIAEQALRTAEEPRSAVTTLAEEGEATNIALVEALSLVLKRLERQNRQLEVFIEQEQEQESATPERIRASNSHSPSPAATTRQPVSPGVGGDSLRLRLEELQNKASSLEEEKVQLSMSLAPLRGRLESAEKAWAAERMTLTSQVTSLQVSLTKAEERIQQIDSERDSLIAERSALNNDVRRLRREAQDKESKTAENFWQRTVAATRQMERLEEELGIARDAAAKAQLEKTKAQQALNPVKEEVEALRASLEESRQVSVRVLEAEAAAREAKDQLDVLMPEFVAHAAALNATQTELAMANEKAAADLKELSERASAEADGLRAELDALRQAIMISSEEEEVEQSDNVVDIQTAGTIVSSPTCVRDSLSGEWVDTSKLLPVERCSVDKLGRAAAYIRNQELQTLSAALTSSKVISLCSLI
jgi:hypothetical protein